MHPQINKRSTITRLLVFGTVLACCWACSSQSYMNINYQLPVDAAVLTGRTVYVETRDLRSDTSVFNAAAKEEFKHFTGLFSLTVENGAEDQKIVGAYPLDQLFETAMKKRLERLGIAIADQPSQQVPTFQLKISQFHINLIGQKWQADISYEASLTQDSQLVAREVVSGSAERMKVIGTGGAEKIVGEIFSDMINKLNIERLYQQAKL